MQTSLVTGANTGIGRETALALAHRGDRVIVACRSEEKGRAAVADLISASGNRSVELLRLDLADLASVRTAAAGLLDAGDPLDVLVANAGLAGQRGATAQGFELAFGTNHLGHFLFVTSLLPLLTGAPSRVVVVASDSHFQAKGIPWDELRRPTKSVTGLPEYAVSKLANVLFAAELARRSPEASVWTGSLHPGVIASDVWRRIPWPVRPIMTRFMKTTTEGAATSIWCATEDAPLAHRGGYFDRCAPKDPNAVATPELAAELWARSEAWVAEATS